MLHRPLLRRVFPSLFSIVLSFVVTVAGRSAQGAGSPLPGTTSLEWTNDLSARMVSGIDQFLTQQTEASIARRGSRWQRDFSSRTNYERSVEPNRQQLARLLGVVDSRMANPELEFGSTPEHTATVAETDLYVVRVVRWPVFEGVTGEGLLLTPKGKIHSLVIAIPDADQTPEMLCGLSPGVTPQSQFARRLAESGCEVVVPVLIDRSDEWSGNARLKRFTNQPHREWIYRQSYELGRHIIGYEIQKLLALVDWFQRRPDLPSGVVGYGEGGLLAFYTAALDSRIDGALVSGYFQSRQQLWQEPIYRNVFGLLEEFGDAEIGSLIAPRPLLIEYSPVPKVSGPPKSRDGRGGAAPGQLITPEQGEVEGELKRLEKLFPPQAAVRSEARLFNGSEGTTVEPGAALPLIEFLVALGQGRDALRPLQSEPILSRPIDAARRQHRQVKQLENFTQRLLRLAEDVRQDFFWSKLKKNEQAREVLRSNLWSEVIGRFDPPRAPLHPRTRLIATNAAWTAYDVVLDVWPEVFAWGILLVPNHLSANERRPVVVCQHGLEGVPQDTITDDPKSSAYRYYKSFSARLAEQGYVVFAPHNPYRGQDRFRVLQRKANPLQKSLFSIMAGQHERILDWLVSQPFVDPARIGFYGLSYGGKTAMRVPALLSRYRLSICSADFNEWIVKNATVESPYSYMFTGEYEMPEFNLGQTFNYAEMAALIAPRPFMVERGHNDGVAPDEWVAYEFAKVRRHYVQSGIGDRTAIEFFDGPHTINGVGTFEFLKRWLPVTPGGK